MLATIDGMEARRRRITRTALLAGEPPPPRAASAAAVSAAAGWGVPLCVRVSPPPPPLPPLHPLTAHHCMHGLAAAAVLLAVGATWYTYVYCLPQRQYNALHPYTSWIPITGEAAWVAQLHARRATAPRR